MKTGIRRVSLFALVAICASLLFADDALMQTTKKPITKKGLISAVKINGYSASDLIKDIQARGVEFQMTASNESSLRSAGASTEVIDAARANYRPKRKLSKPTMP